MQGKRKMSVKLKHVTPVLFLWLPRPCDLFAVINKDEIFVLSFVIYRDKG